MSRRFILRRTVIGGITLFLLVGGLANEVKADNLMNQNPIVVKKEMDDGISIASTNIVWCYKMVNGKRYMRLYDSSKEVWLTDWILCK